MSSPKWAGHLRDLNARKPFQNFEYYLIDNDGKIIWLRVSGEPRFDANGSFIGYRGTGHDVTDEKLAIARLEATNAALHMRNQQLDATRQALERSAFEDALTEVWNRRAFERDLQDTLAFADRNVGLLHIDLDRFKWVNDTLGHPAGDTVLKTAAARIKCTTGALGTPYRVGGDEFMVVLSDHVSQEMAIRLGHQITNALAAPISIGRSAVRVGASIGVAVAGGRSVSARTLISQVDAALYEAKAKGRNSVCATTRRMCQRIEEDRRIAADLPTAIERDELVPYFQPQMDLQTSEIIGVEALVRWQHAERGLIQPDDFLALATELALCDEIDRLMLKRGSEAVDRLAAGGLQLPSLSINTSQARLMDPRLIADVGCFWSNPNCSLSLELLETIDFDCNCDHNHLHQTLNRLRRMGVRIELDEFGSAHASITGLLRVAPNRLKIDSCLVKDIVTNPDKRSIVRAIVDLAQSLNVDCLAGGVEDQATLDVLLTLGCTQVQGDAVAPALSEDKLAAFLRTHRIAKRASELHQKCKTADPVGLPRSA